MDKTINKKIHEEVMQPKLKQENDVRVAILETSMGHINQTLERIEKNLVRIEDKFDKKFDALDTKFDKKFDSLDIKFEKKFDSMNNRMWNNFIWLLVTMGTFSLLLAGTMAKGFHWIGG
jgi:predicted nuclease with TOPRIM domain